ncbi:helix-turn-helix domain-containing protein [Chlorogloeopsis sp. ULAP01]|uniref:helix-turn-helix domain-containing protein n=1 Tax=Chlorogloeopsis sp. ULAP01 TaxID=3056483 RepID=UPI0025AA63F0|nr:helix-turn-helix domain-containing protein [Chlorogloeopsis sp. ULAP01]MDM9380426.1 helix-turn-helix domain-containing protein [Chlorogloeopsis sp. ULAP01]
MDVDKTKDVNKVKIDKFAQKTRAMDQRIAQLYENVIAMPVPANAVPQALLELGTASQKLHHAIEELYQQNEQLEQTQEILEEQYQRYEELFEEAPDGYLVTDAQGCIQEANYTATKLLNVEKRFLVGKLMISFVALEQRQCFRDLLTQLSQHRKSQELIIGLQQRGGKLFNAALTVAVTYNQQGKPQNLRWLLRDTTDSRRGELALNKKDYNFSSDRPLHKYSKREIIPLDPQTIWYVHQGLVKLTTLCETNEEVLVGLAVPGMVFGSYMTSLNTYQATALSDTELVSISVFEIIASPSLSHALLPKINQRLRQTESFLVISGLRKVHDRLECFLQLLKQEIGETVVQGTRLKVRLTHEDFANACCTTRVTITRLLCKLKKQGRISFDVHRYIILRNID